jgi:hypothetical protein
MDDKIDLIHAVARFGSSRVMQLQGHCEKDWDSIEHLWSEPACTGHKHHQADMVRTVLFQRIGLDLHMHVSLQGARWEYWIHTENSTFGLGEMEDFGSELNRYLQEIAKLEDIRYWGQRREQRWKFES